MYGSGRKINLFGQAISCHKVLKSAIYLRLLLGYGNFLLEEMGCVTDI